MTDEEIEKLLKDMKKIGIKGHLVTGEETEISDEEREKGK